MKNIIPKGLSILLLSAPVAVMADQGNWYPSGHMWGSGGWMWGGTYMWVVIFALAVLGIYAFSKSGKSSGADQAMADTPLDILDARYAKGEIDKEDYEARRETLQSNS